MARSKKTAAGAPPPTTAQRLGSLLKADQKADPRRRRALTEDELTRLLAVAVVRPLTDARTVRRGQRKGQTYAELRPETVARLQTLGRERALMYKTLVLAEVARGDPPGGAGAGRHGIPDRRLTRGADPGMSTMPTITTQALFPRPVGEPGRTAVRWPRRPRHRS